MIKGIHHVCMKCSNEEQFEKTIGFYRDVLKLPVAASWGEGAGRGITLETGAGKIELFVNAECDLPQGAIRHFALAVDDTDAVAETVRAAGYQITVEPKTVTLPANPPMPIRIAFFIGPAGEEVEIFQEL